MPQVLKLNGALKFRIPASQFAIVVHELQNHIYRCENQH